MVAPHRFARRVMLVREAAPQFGALNTTGFAGHVPGPENRCAKLGAYRQPARPAGGTQRLDALVIAAVPSVARGDEHPAVPRPVRGAEQTGKIRGTGDVGQVAGADAVDAGVGAERLPDGRGEQPLPGDRDALTRAVSHVSPRR